MAFATPKPRVSEKTAEEDAALAQALAQARTQAVQMLDRAYPSFQVAVTDSANDELRSLRNNLELAQRLKEGLDTYLHGRTLTQELLDSFMRQQDEATGTPQGPGNKIVYDFARQEGLAFFYQFGTFNYNYSSRSGSISIEPVIDTEKLDQFLSDFRTNCEDRVVWGLYGTHTPGPDNSGTISGDEVTIQKLSEIFNSEIAYAGSQASPVAVTEVPRAKLPLTMGEDGTMRWSAGVLSKDQQVSG
jgi:hypothetical protein